METIYLNTTGSICDDFGPHRLKIVGAAPDTKYSVWCATGGNLMGKKKVKRAKVKCATPSCKRLLLLEQEFCWQCKLKRALGKY